MSLRLSDHKVLLNIASSVRIFFNFAWIFSLFLLIFHTSNFWTLRNLIKLLFHLRLLDMRLVIANSYPTRAHGIIITVLLLIILDCYMADMMASMLVIFIIMLFLLLCIVVA